MKLKSAAAAIAATVFLAMGAGAAFAADNTSSAPSATNSGPGTKQGTGAMTQPMTDMSTDQGTMTPEKCGTQNQTVANSKGCQK